MRNTMHPNFILGLVSLLVLIFGGVGLKGNGFSSAEYVLIGGLILGGIHWLWAIIDVFTHQNLKSQSRVLWSILVIAIPIVGGILYYSMSKTVRM